MRPVVIGAVLLVGLSLAGCSARHPASSASSESTAPPVTASSASPSDDGLGSIDSSLSTVNGAIQQSQGDLSDGDASAAKDDNQ